ncbi:MAG TPA: hypothetical protein VM598_07095 [Bdellovibrionota bacterium]|nr:hypothetical protein [Bdellovibrionota bacterium]
MRVFLIAMAFALAAPALLSPAHADGVFKIEIGRDYSKYSNTDLQRRVWELERAVWQLQQQVFQLASAPAQAADTWACTISAMGGNYTGTGPSKATAAAKAIENCKKERADDGFFCKNPRCEQ